MMKEDTKQLAMLIGGVLLFFGMTFYWVNTQNQREDQMITACIQSGHQPLECKQLVK